VTWHRAIRVLSLLVFAAGIGLLIHRLERSPEQKDLTHYVEAEVPALQAAEGPIQQRIERLGKAPGLKPEEARALLVDDVIPRLIKLRKAAGDARTETQETRTLHAEYLKVTDRLIEACRTCVRVIDDPKVSTVDGFKKVQAEFAAVRQAYFDWDEHVREACVRNRLAPPAARPAEAK
jgi:hypothetical protein